MKAGPAAEIRPAQKIIITLAFIALVLMPVVSAFDHRFGWSQVPAWLSVLGNALVALGLMIDRSLSLPSYSTKQDCIPSEMDRESRAALGLCHGPKPNRARADARLPAAGGHVMTSVAKVARRSFGWLAGPAAWAAFFLVAYASESLICTRLGELGWHGAIVVMAASITVLLIAGRLCLSVSKHVAPRSVFGRAPASRSAG
ncbi:hypothetical protein AB6806_21270 [Bosea sp. RCC_152_1]|uniref:hypothetical protein n=1 Tax=Bosea sp. RCC_152_1 TaxID=3239228 RepID=UPI0035261297